MVIEWIFGLLAGIIEFIVGLFPDLPTPEFIDGIGTNLAPITSRLAGFGAWVPFGAVSTSISFISAAIGVALIIKIVRIVASFFTAGGGSAA